MTDFFRTAAAALWLPAQPGLSLLLWLLVGLALLYAARPPVTHLVLVLTRGGQRLLRWLVKCVQGVNRRLQLRNREVLLARERVSYERKLEKDFVRIAEQVSRDLSVWPSLQREMREQLTRMEGEVERAAIVPPQPPEWLQVVDAVAQIPAQGSSVMASILKDIHRTLQRAMDKAVTEYRRVHRKRHALLGGLVPQWRSLGAQLDGLDIVLARLDQRTRLIDQHMQTYQQILQGSERVIQALSRSAFSQLLLAGSLVLIALAGGLVNFQLLVLPMAEVVGVQGRVLGVDSTSLAVTAVLLLQWLLSLFLFEVLGLTRLLPDMASLETRRRRMLALLAGVALLVLAAMEAVLIYTRDILLADTLSLNRELAMPAPDALWSLGWIPLLGQVVIGFALPLLLSFSVLAFEVFVHALRTVAGMFLSWLLDGLVLLLRALVMLLRLAGQGLLAAYDVLIFLPLFLERQWQRRAASRAVVDGEVEAASVPEKKA